MCVHVENSPTFLRNIRMNKARQYESKKRMICSSVQSNLGLSVAIQEYVPGGQVSVYKLLRCYETQPRTHIPVFTHTNSSEERLLSLCIQWI